METAKKIYQNIQDGSLDLNAAESGVQVLRKLKVLNKTKLVFILELITIQGNCHSQKANINELSLSTSPHSLELQEQPSIQGKVSHIPVKTNLT